jgi:uncharacterized protein
MRWLPAAIIVATLFKPALARAGDYAPLDCAKANSDAERTICRSYALGQQEARMATLFSVATSLVAMGQRGDILDGRRKWLETREACGKRISCLTATYDTRIRELNDVVVGIASRGPY